MKKIAGLFVLVYAFSQVLYCEDFNSFIFIIADFSIPVYKDLTVKSELSKGKDGVRRKLRTLPHECSYGFGV